MSAPTHHRPPEDADPALPPVSPVLLGLFERYAGWYLGRHIHSMRLDTSGWMPATAPDSIPTVVFLNHASWWDPLVCLHLRRALFPGRTAYAPIDAQAIQRYSFFRHLGFFGVEPDSRRGAAAFLGVARAISRRPSTMLWLTPQGRFADVRDRPIHLRPGLAHLAARLARPGSAGTSAECPVRFLPLAIEYTFWEERLPEILVRFGEPIDIPSGYAHGVHPRPSAWNDALSRRLEEAMDQLAGVARRRDTHDLIPLLGGREGVGGVYDLWLRWNALLQGRGFQARHGNL